MSDEPVSDASGQEPNPSIIQGQELYEEGVEVIYPPPVKPEPYDEAPEDA